MNSNNKARNNSPDENNSPMNLNSENLETMQDCLSAQEWALSLDSAAIRELIKEFSNPADEPSSTGVAGSEDSKLDLCSQARLHIPHCIRCQSEIKQLVKEEQQLSQHFSSVELPEVPLELVRQAVFSQKTRKARVFTPFIPLLLLLVALLLIALFSRLLLKKQQYDRCQILVQSVEAAMQKHPAQWLNQQKAYPNNWEEELGLKLSSTEKSEISLAADGSLTDAYGSRYRLKFVGGSWKVYSIGEDKVDQDGAGDDQKSW